MPVNRINQAMRTTSVVVPAASTTQQGRTEPQVLARKVPHGRLVVNAETVGDPQQLEQLLRDMASAIDRETEGAKSNPFGAGNLHRGIATPGARGNIASGIATATITLTRAADAALFAVGDTVVCCTTDGLSFGTQRVGSVTLTGVNTAAGTLTAAAAWNASIATIAAGDYLFKSGEFTASGTPGSVRVAHRLRKAPTWWWVVATTKGSVAPRLALKSADDTHLELYSDRAAVVDLFVVTD